jgi:Ca-activated chloride channel family protein
VVLFTDGEDNRSRLSVDQIIEIARASEASIFSVAQGTDEAKTLRVYLDKLADETGGRSYFIRNIRKLQEVFRQILTELKSQYFMTYTPREIRHGSWHRIDVKVGRPSLTVRAKKEYYVE